MNANVKKTLKKHIRAFMKDKGINWGNIQRENIKEVFGVPVGWRTLHKIMKDPKYKSMHASNQSKLLTFFNIPHTKEFGIVTLKTLKENEEV